MSAAPETDSVAPPPTPRTALRAGPWALEFDHGDLRYLRWGEREVLRRIYAAVRDENWGTVPAELSALDITAGADRFAIRYTATHRQGPIHFVWQAHITGDAEGVIRFTFDGEAKTTFRRNRIGFCVLHPIRECAGAVGRARYADGSEGEVRFPDTIAAEQPVTGMVDLAGLAHEVAAGVWAEVEFFGDRFEMEDQRNWIDASFKTFCTPLRLPFPVEIPAGTRVRQEVRLRLVGRSGGVTAVPASRPPVASSRADATVRVSGGVVPLPSIGLGVASHGSPLRPGEVNRLRGVRPAHLRVDLRTGDGEGGRRLEQAGDEAARLGAGLEVALHLDVVPEAGLRSVAEALARQRGRLARVLVFHRNQRSTTLDALRAARQVLKDGLAGVAVGAGTDADLYQLNLQRPPADADFIVWSMNPQVHAFDDTSIAETPEAAAHQVSSVGRYFPGKPRVVSPVTLRPRFNPNATGPGPGVAPDELPPSVDPRQLSLFGAAWTLAMLKALAESGASSVTLFETTGWRGVMETEEGSALPAKFPSMPGAVFPLFHVLADVGEFAGGEVMVTETSQPLRIASLGLRAGLRRRLIVANLGAEPRRVTLGPEVGRCRARVLDASTRRAAMQSPEAFRAGGSAHRGAELELGPHAIVTLDAGDP